MAYNNNNVATSIKYFKPRKVKQRIAFALIMGIVTTCIISFSLIAINVGFVPNFVGLWLKSWVLAYAIVIPAILVISPQVQKLVDRLFAVN